MARNRTFHHVSFFLRVLLIGCASSVASSCLKRWQTRDPCRARQTHRTRVVGFANASELLKNHRTIAGQMLKKNSAKCSVQEYAISSFNSGAHGIEWLAQAGGAWRHPQNTCSRSRQGRPNFLGLRFPPRVARRSTLFRSSTRVFAKYFVDRAEHTECVKRQLQRPRSQWTKTVPIGVHGDGAAFNKHESIHYIVELSRRERVHGCEALRFHNGQEHRVRARHFGQHLVLELSTPRPQA